MGFLSTTAQLLDDALTKAGEKTDGTSDFESDALKYMDVFYKTILAGGSKFDTNLAEPWSWAKAQYPGVLTLEAPYETGTVALTQASTSATFSSAPAASQLGKYLRLNSRPEVFRIAAHTAGATAFTLDSIYTDTTTSAISYKAIKLDYSLDAASILRLIGAMRVDRVQEADKQDAGSIEAMDMPAFQREYPWMRITEGVPTAFSIVYQTENTITVRFNRYVDRYTRVNYDYIPVPTDLADSSSSLPLLPAEFREVLSHATAHSILADKEDTKAEYHLNATKAQLTAMINANRKRVSQSSKRRGHFYPRQDQLVKNRVITSGGY